MDPLAILQIDAMLNGLQKHHRRETSSKSVDHKIRNFVLSRIHLPLEGSLLASTTALHSMIPIMLGTKNEENWIKMPKRRKPILVSAQKKTAPSKYYPIGLIRIESYRWINALMQFLLFIPILREFFAYTPDSLFPFNEFIDQYFFDILEKKLISIADSMDLIRCLARKFPRFFQEAGVVNLLEIIRVISDAACTMTSLGDAGFRPEWQIVWDPKQDLSFQEIFDRSVLPPELLVGLLPLFDPILRRQPESFLGRTLLKQYVSSHSFSCYELDAFVEHRSDIGEKACYFTYLKIDGGWIQCADERVLPLRRSTSLDLPLRRGILFHYRRVLIS